MQSPETRGVNKKDLTETDIRTKFITPAILGPNGSKWNVMTQVLEERYFTKGRIIVRGKTVQRGEAKKADYILFLQAEHSNRSRRGKGQQSFCWRGNAAGTGLRGDA